LALAVDRPGDVMVVIAGDGLNPSRERVDQAWPLLRHHRDLLAEERIRYLRIQHAQGTHLSWARDFLATLRTRSDPSTVSLQWEAEHGASINIVLVALRHRGAQDTNEWSLENWDIARCGVLFANLAGRGSDYQVGLFTERMHGEINQELIHFGRAHCHGLMRQASVGDTGQAAGVDEFEDILVDQIARWLERIRGWRRSLSMPPAGRSRASWIAQRLAIADDRLAAWLERHMLTDEPALELAREMWQEIAPWPGPLWQALQELD